MKSINLPLCPGPLPVRMSWPRTPFWISSSCLQLGKGLSSWLKVPTVVKLWWRFLGTVYNFFDFCCYLVKSCHGASFCWDVALIASPFQSICHLGTFSLSFLSWWASSPGSSWEALGAFFFCILGTVPRPRSLYSLAPTESSFLLSCLGTSLPN